MTTKELGAAATGMAGRPETCRAVGRPTPFDTVSLPTAQRRTVGEWWSREGRQAAYGPWSPTVDRIERDRQLRCLAGIARMMLGPRHDLPTLLRQAETDDAAFQRAGQLVEALPGLTRRRLLGTFSAVTWPREVRP